MPLDPGFKRIRNQITKCDLNSLVDVAVTKLHWAENRSAADLKSWLPWRLLLLVKWGFEFGGGQHPPTLVDERLLVKLMNLIHAYEGESTHPFLAEGTPEGLHRFLRTIAYQQFWLQHRLGKWEVARQHLLFCRLPADHPVQVQFTELFGISMACFLEFAVMVWTWLSQSAQNITFSPNALFANVNYSPDEISAFLRGTALTAQEVRRYLNERKQAITNPYFQLVEQTPFVRYPILRQGANYLVYSRRVFEATLGSLFYDVMKLYGGSPAAEQFGEVLERYIEKGLLHLGHRFYSERNLLQGLPGTKVTDFVVPYEDCTVMIEVKAVEVRQTVRVYPESGRLAAELEDSVVKAVIQGLTVAQALKDGLTDLDVPCRSEFFLLVVTYRDMYLGPGEELWNDFLREAVTPELQRRALDVQLLPPSKIVVLAIDEFDQLVSVLAGDPSKLPAILRKMEVDNGNYQSMKLNFSQHLDAYSDENTSLPYLNEEFDLVMGGILQRFKDLPQ